MNAPRAQVNLDPVVEAIDRAMDHPWARVAARIFPEAAAEVRAVRDQLPTIAAEAQDRIGDHIKEEVRELEREAIAGVKRMARRAFKKGKRR